MLSHALFGFSSLQTFQRWFIWETNATFICAMLKNIQTAFSTLFLLYRANLQPQQKVARQKGRDTPRTTSHGGRHKNRFEWGNWSRKRDKTITETEVEEGVRRIRGHCCSVSHLHVTNFSGYLLYCTEEVSRMHFWCFYPAHVTDKGYSRYSW